MYNLVELCDYGDSKDRIIRDVLIIGCNSDKAKDKIVQQGEKIKLQEVIEILQMEDSTRQTLSEMSSNGQKNFPSINYVSYDKKKSKSKKKGPTNPNHSSSSSSSSIGQKQDSTGKQCFRCKKPYTEGHEKVCKAQNAKCNACGIVGHYEIACKKSGNFPQKPQNSSSTGRMNMATAIEDQPLSADFFDEKGLPKEYKPKQMNVLFGSGSSQDKPIMIEFGCGLTPLSFDRKLTLQADTGAEVNAINKKTFKELFPNVELEESSLILQNFDKRLIKPVGSFRCFLRWKGLNYRVKIEVMGTDTPNLLSRETTFLKGILKKCLVVETPKLPSSDIPSSYIPSSDIPCSENPSLDMRGTSSHSSTETIPLIAGLNQLPSSENLSQDKKYTGNVSRQSSVSGQSVLGQSSVPGQNVSGQTKSSLSIVDLPLTQEKVESTYADIFQGLGKFPGEPYKLRLKPDAVPAKHRPRKVPVRLQEAFHEEVE